MNNNATEQRSTDLAADTRKALPKADADLAALVHGDPAVAHKLIGITEHGDRVFLDEPAGTEILPHPRGPVPMVYAAMIAAMAAIGKQGVGKAGTNLEHNYKFRSIDDVYNVANTALAAAHLMILPSTITRELVEHRSAAGKAMWRVTLKQMFTFVCALDGSSHEVGPFFGEAFDSSDKATNKALTQAYKYMLIEVFCIPLVGIDDADENTPEVEHGTGEPEKETKREREVVDQGETIDKNTAVMLRNRLKHAGIPERLFCEKANTDSIEQLSKAMLEPATGWIARQVKKMAEAKAEQEAKAKGAVPGTPNPPAERQPGEDDEQQPVDPDVRTYNLHVAGGGTLPQQYTGKQPEVGGVIMIGEDSFKIVEVRGLDSQWPTLFVDQTTPKKPAADDAQVTHKKKGKA